MCCRGAEGSKEPCKDVPVIRGSWRKVGGFSFTYKLGLKNLIRGRTLRIQPMLQIKDCLKNTDFTGTGLFYYDKTDFT